MSMKISIVIAVYHNQGALIRTYEEIKSVLDKDLNEYEYEIIFVDDGSKDNSLNEIISLKECDENIKAISFTRNFGQMAAILAGLQEADGDVVINISADLQDPIDLIPKMIANWKEGSEIVICHRIDRSDPFTAKVFSKIAYSILKVSIPQMPVGGFDYVLMDRKVKNVFSSIDVRHRFFQGDILWTGFRTSMIEYVRNKREIGKSQYNFNKKYKIFLDAILDASYLPIRFISLLGLITSMMGVLYSVFIFIGWCLGDTPFQGWAPIMIIILLIGGMIMVMLGVIGEYVWRINEEVRKRPNYVVRDKYL